MQGPGLMEDLALNYLSQPWPRWTSLSVAPALVVVYNEYQLHFLLVIISSVVLTLFSYHDMISYHIIPLLWVAYRNFCVTFPRWKWTSVTTVRVGCSLLWNLPIYQCTAKKKKNVGYWSIWGFWLGIFNQVSLYIYIPESKVLPDSSISIRTL